MKMKFLVGQLFAVALVANLIKAQNEEQRLVRKLLKDYQKVGIHARPVYNYSETTRISLGVALVQIMEFNEKEQYLKTKLWLRHIWADYMLRWNPDEYGGVDHVRLPASEIWTPDITLYNTVEPVKMSGPVMSETMATVSSDGTVPVIPHVMAQSSCSVDVTRLPFDHQTCILKVKDIILALRGALQVKLNLHKFASWSYDGFKMDLDFFDNLEEIDVSDYVESNEWELMGHPAFRNIRYYPCCIEPYVDLTFTLKLRRIAAMHVYTLVAPPVMLSFLSLLMFFMSASVSERGTFGITMLAGFFLLLLLMFDITPEAASSIPLLTVYLFANMLLVTLGLLLSVFVCYIHDLPETAPMSTCFRRLLNGRLGSLCCLKNRENSEVGSYSDTKQPVIQKTYDWKLLAKLIDRILILVFLTMQVLLLFIVPLHA